MDQKGLDNYSNQKNSNNKAFWDSRGENKPDSGWIADEKPQPSQKDLDNYSNQKNPNNPEYWNSRGKPQFGDEIKDEEIEEAFAAGSSQNTSTGLGWGAIFGVAAAGIAALGTAYALSRDSRPPPPRSPPSRRLPTPPSPPSNN